MEDNSALARDIFGTHDYFTALVFWVSSPDYRFRNWYEQQIPFGKKTQSFIDPNRATAAIITINEENNYRWRHHDFAFNLVWRLICCDFCLYHVKFSVDFIRLFLVCASVRLVIQSIPLDLTLTCSQSVRYVCVCCAPMCDERLDICVLCRKRKKRTNKKERNSTNKQNTNTHGASEKERELRPSVRHIDRCACVHAGIGYFWWYFSESWCGPTRHTVTNRISVHLLTLKWNRKCALNAHKYTPVGVRVMHIVCVPVCWKFDSCSSTNTTIQMNACTNNCWLCH